MKVWGKGAFTLTEMSVALVVMGVLTLIIAPFASNMRAAAEREGVRSAAAAILLAQKAFQVRNSSGQFYCPAGTTPTEYSIDFLDDPSRLNIDFAQGHGDDADAMIYNDPVTLRCSADRRAISIGLVDGDSRFCLQWDGEALVEMRDRDGACPAP